MTTAHPGDAGPAVRDNEAEHRYELTIGNHVAVLQYLRHPGVIDLRHTEVPPALRGQGLAHVLARAALDDAQRGGLRVIATCPFVKAYLSEHPEYQGLVR